MTADHPDHSGSSPGTSTPLTRVRRKPDRARYDRAAVYAVLDAAPFSHVGTIRHGRPVVLPMAHARLADQLVLHGSPAAGLFRDGRQGSPVCVTATLYDGLVLARSARNHSMNYRSVCLHGDAVAVIDPDQIIAGLRALVDHVIPGRWDQVRKPTSAELRETALWQVAITEASVKIRSGSTLEPESDGAIPVWAGHIPAQLTYGQPIRADRLARHLELPDFVSRLPGVVRHDIQVDPR